MFFLRRIVQAFRLGQLSPDRPDKPDRLDRPGSPDRLAYYNTYEARMFFSYIIERVSHGEEIVIGRSGVPTVKLVPYRGEGVRPGVLRFHVRVGRDRRGG
jgi:antitoxin (DNA-binding transcriptional repressor) of toxin-antitoxin stability system